MKEELAGTALIVSSAPEKDKESASEVEAACRSPSEIPLKDRLVSWEKDTAAEEMPGQKKKERNNNGKAKKKEKERSLLGFNLKRVWYGMVWYGMVWAYIKIKPEFI